MNHTPTPWKTCGFENLTVNDSEGNTIIACPGSSTGTLVEMKATAQFIVRACNAHEELVKSLNEMTTILSAIQNTLTGYLTPDSTLDQDDCINAVLDISDHEETLYKQRSALQLLAALQKGV